MAGSHLVMSNRDKEAFIRMALSRASSALEEVKRIRSEIYDCGAFDAAEESLEDAAANLTLGRDAAAGEFGFVMKDSMPT